MWNFTIGNKKLFPVDGVTGRRLLTLADLEAISDLTVTADGAEPAHWVEVELDYADFAAAATTSDTECYSLAAGEVILASCIKHSVAFAGGSLSSYTISLGIVGALTKFATAEDVFQAVADGTFQYAAYAGGPETMGTAATSVRAAATGSHNLNTATAGVVSIYLLVSRMWAEE